MEAMNNTKRTFKKIIHNFTLLIEEVRIGMLSKDWIDMGSWNFHWAVPLFVMLVFTSD
jgi:hypothetical protein